MDKFEEPQPVIINKLNLEDTFSINLNVWTRHFFTQFTLWQAREMQRHNSLTILDRFGKRYVTPTILVKFQSLKPYTESEESSFHAFSANLS